MTDGRGQLLAIADSTGDITAGFAGAGYDQGAWQGGGLTSRAQTFDPRKWETSMDWACPAPRGGGGGGIQQFRNRAYDPGTGTWIQEDPIGVAGGVNLYQYSNTNPVSFGDPFGWAACPPDCPVGTYTALGMMVGAVLGAESGGVGGAVLGAIGGAGLGAPTGPGALGTAAVGATGGAAAGAAAGAATGALIGGAVGALVDGIVHLRGESEQFGAAIRSEFGRKMNTAENRGRLGDYCHECKASGHYGKKNAKGDFSFEDLKRMARELFVREN